jgi:hypothetical protein
MRDIWWLEQSGCKKQQNKYKKITKLKEQQFGQYGFPEKKKPCTWMCDGINGSQDPLDLVSLKWFQSKITVQLEIVPVLVTIFPKKIPRQVTNMILRSTIP